MKTVYIVMYVESTHTHISYVASTSEAAEQWISDQTYPTSYEYEKWTVDEDEFERELSIPAEILESFDSTFVNPPKATFLFLDLDGEDDN